MIYLINIGDSRAIIISNDGTVLAHTEGKWNTKADYSLKKKAN